MHVFVYFSVFAFTLNFSYTNEMALYNFTLALTSPKFICKALPGLFLCILSSRTLFLKS
jgi:hypothetical protein